MGVKSINKKVLFEIPIYSTSESDFNDKWKKRTEKEVAEFIVHGHSDEDARGYVKMLNEPKDIWKYNQIIGYIQISITSKDIFFDIFYSSKQRFDSTRKAFIKNKLCDGLHFYIDNKSDAYIKKEIRSWLKEIEKKDLLKNSYIDYSVFNNIFDYVNIKKIIQTL